MTLIFSWSTLTPLALITWLGNKTFFMQNSHLGFFAKRDSTSRMLNTHPNITYDPSKSTEYYDIIEKHQVICFELIVEDLIITRLKRCWSICFKPKGITKSS